MSESEPIAAAASHVASRNPATGEVWAEYEIATPVQVRQAVGLARAAGSDWSSRPIRERCAVLERFRRSVVDRRDEIVNLLCRETGKPPAEGLFELFGAAEYAHYYARIAPRVLACRTWRSSNLAFWRKRIFTELEPHGVIGLITPWNYPFLLASGLTLPALAAGNGVVLKPSELTPSSGDLLLRLLVEAGLPENLFRIIHGAGPTGRALVASGVDKIFFIGSASTGREVALEAARNMTPTVLELGGSDPAIVLEDAHLPTAAKGIAWGRFTNAGQTCVAPKRVFVVDAVYEEFLVHLENAVKRIGKTGVGPLITAAQRERLNDQLEDALARGAQIATRSPVPAEGSYFPPTVLVGVTSGMRVLEEETFGPLLPVMRVRDADEAIERANATIFGLSASIWSRDVSRARELARRIEAGTVTINDSLVVALLADMPYGGVKASGTGRTHGEEGLRECVRSRSTVVDRFARFRESYWHFYGRETRGGFDSFLVFAHGRGLWKRFLAGLRAIRLLYLKREVLHETGTTDHDDGTTEIRR